MTQLTATESVDFTIDEFILANYDKLCTAGKKKELIMWRTLLSKIHSENDAKYAANPEELRWLNAYATERVISRECEFPYFTSPLARNFVHKYHSLPEGKEWGEYIEKHVDKKMILKYATY